MRPTLVVLAALAACFSVATSRAEDPPPSKNADPPVTFAFENADVREVLQALTTYAGANVVISPRVQGRVTVHLEAVPFSKALEQIASAVGASARRDDHGIWVLDAGLPPEARAGTPAGDEERRSDLSELRREVALLRAEVREVRTMVQQLFDAPRGR